jgi:hypothetical protein
MELASCSNPNWNQNMATTQSFIHVPINVVHLFEFTKNCSFGFLYHFRLRELLVLVLWKKKMWESKNCQPWLFGTPLKNQPFSWKNQQWTGTFVASYLIFPVFLELGLWVFRTMVMNPKNHVDNHQGSVPLSQHLLQFLNKRVCLRARTSEKHIFFLGKGCKYIVLFR